MKISTEIKIGITGILTVVVLLWGINYLKGKNILTSMMTYYAGFDEVNGLEASANVMYKGFKIGTVEKVEFDMKKDPPFMIEMEVGKKYPIPAGSVAEIFSADLLGNKAIRIHPSPAENYYHNYDTLRSDIAQDMVTSLLNEIGPLASRINDVAGTLDSLGKSLNQIINDDTTRDLLNNLSASSASLKEQFEPSGDAATTIREAREIIERLSARSEDIDQSIANLRSITDQVNNAGIDSLVYQLTRVTSSLSDITGEIKKGSGTAGKLIYEDSLYQQLHALSRDLDSLVVDLKNNPGDYVRFSVFGK